MMDCYSIASVTYVLCVVLVLLGRDLDQTFNVDFLSMRQSWAHMITCKTFATHFVRLFIILERIFFTSRFNKNDPLLLLLLLHLLLLMRLLCGGDALVIG